MGRSDLSAGPKDTVVLASPDQDTERDQNGTQGAEQEKHNRSCLLSVNNESGTPLSFFYTLSGLILTAA